MSDYKELVKELRGCKYIDYCKDCPRMANGYVEFCNIKDDAAAAIEELQAKVDDYEDTLKWHQKEFAELRAMIDDANERLEVGKAGNQYTLNASAQPHWVSVEERLPNVDEKVLVFAIGKLDGFIGDTVIALTSMSNTNWLNHHEKVDKPYWLDPWQYFLTDYRITHWMPLPEPPQEVQDGKC